MRVENCHPELDSGTYISNLKKILSQAQNTRIFMYHNGGVYANYS